MKKISLLTISILLFYLINFKLNAQMKNDSINLSLMKYKPDKANGELIKNKQKLNSGNISISSQGISISESKKNKEIQLYNIPNLHIDTLKSLGDYKQVDIIKKKLDKDSKPNGTINYDESKTINIDNNQDMNMGRDMNNNRDRNRDLKRDKNRDRNRDRNKEKKEKITKIKIKIQYY